MRGIPVAPLLAASDDAVHTRVTVTGRVEDDPMLVAIWFKAAKQRCSCCRMSADDDAGSLGSPPLVPSSVEDMVLIPILPVVAATRSDLPRVVNSF